MTQDDLTLLREHGFAADVLIVLTHFGYKLNHHDPVTEIIEVSVEDHGFTLHRNESPIALRKLIVEVGFLAHQKQTRDAFQSIAALAGMRLS